MKTLNVSTQSTSPTIRQWHEAGSLLSSALSNYLSLCKLLKANSLQEGVHPKDLASHIDSALGTLQVVSIPELNDSLSALSRARNEILSPFSSIPEELLTKIFMDVVFLDVWRPQNPPNPQPSSMEQSLTKIWRAISTLLAVCSTWRNIVVNHSIFWSTVTIYHASKRHFGRTMAPEISIPRAGEGALHLTAVLDAGSKPKEVKEMASHIAGRTAQLRTINIRAPMLPMLWLFSALLESGTYPSLSELSLGQIGLMYDQTGMAPELFQVVRHNSDFWAPFTELLRSLSVLRINAASFSWPHMTFSNQLVELHLQQLVVGQNHTLAGLLNSAPELRRLKIISVLTFHDSSEAGGTILLHNLESLLLQDLYFNTLEFLLKSIVPSPQRLELHLTEHSKQIALNGLQMRAARIEDLYSILNLLSVHTLLLSYTSISPTGTIERWLTDPELRVLLKCMPSIKILKMRGWLCNAETGKTLKRPQSEGLGDGEFFPKFEEIYMTSTEIFDQDALKDIIASHSPRKLVLGGDLYLQGGPDGCALYDGMGKLPGYEENPIGWLRSNVPEFHLLEFCDPAEFYSDIWQLW
ncbi:unnamed protein product [Rhizoctonia solani]|uniref:F-box domain-containing protein n=1 Tax=Rhizoctonia solani TaxID=456999 RepID=A0A8H3CDV2_9AGAM|nr:unnamed protein product [Rhizoctonia solani]